MAFVDLCRLCGTDTLNIVRNAIFEGEGRVKKYALKISECLTLKVDKEDLLPKIMCGECAYKLDLFSDFKAVAYKTESQLLSRIEVKTEPPDVTDIPNLDNGDVGGDTDIRSSSPEQPLEPAVQIKEEVPQAEERPAATEMQELSKEHSVPDVVTASVGGNDTVSSSLELPAEPEAQIKEEVIQTKKHQQISKLATKRSMKESESEKEQPAKKRGRKVKQTPATISKEAATTPAAASTTPAAASTTPVAASTTPAAASTTPAAAPPKDNTGVDPLDPFDCQWCRKKCVSSAELKLHMRSCGKSGQRLTVQVQRLSKEQVPTTKPQGVYDCNKCSKSFLSLKNLRTHKAEHVKKLPLFKCSTNRRCKHSFKTIGALLVHIKAKHKDLSVFTCYNCEKSFKTTPTFKQHLEYHAGGAPNTIKCLQYGCKQVFTAPGQIREHMKVHDGMEQCKVNGCTFKSCNQSGMRLHKSSVHAIWAHCCQLCGKGFYWSTHLKQHMDEHEKLDKNAEGKELHCAVSGCEETFTRCIDLETHAARTHQSHSSEKMASSSNSDKKCHLCGVTVNGELRDLWEHTLKHEKKIPGVFQCTFKICSQKFYSAADLQQHTEKHYLGNKLQPQSCDFPNCPMTFRSIQGLQLHKRRKHVKEVVTTNACHLCTMQVEHALCVSYHTYSRNEAMSQAEAPEVAGAQYVLVSKEDGVEEVVFISNPS